TLALGEAGRSGVARIAVRELLLGSMLGSSLGVLAFGIGCTLVMPSHAAVVGITVMLVVMVGTVIGAMLPLWFKWIGVDPALMSNPLIASLSDIMGVVIFYN